MATVSWDAGRKKTLTIPQSGQTSDVINMGSMGARGAYRIGLLAPDAFTGIVTLDVSDAEAGPFRTLQSDNIDVVLSADKAAVLDPMPFPYLRFVSSLAEGADRDIVVMAISGVGM